MSTPEPPRHYALANLIRDGEWRPFYTGIELQVLSGTPGIDAVTALVRYQPGAVLASHVHGGLEQILVIAGSQRDEHGEYPEGTFVINPAGSRHSVWSPGGCVVLVSWQAPAVFDQPRVD